MKSFLILLFSLATFMLSSCVENNASAITSSEIVGEVVIDGSNPDYDLCEAPISSQKSGRYYIYVVLSDAERMELYGTTNPDSIFRVHFLVDQRQGRDSSTWDEDLELWVKMGPNPFGVSPDAPKHPTLMNDSTYMVYRRAKERGSAFWDFLTREVKVPLGLILLILALIIIFLAARNTGSDPDEGETSEEVDSEPPVTGEPSDDQRPVDQRPVAETQTQNQDLSQFLAAMHENGLQADLEIGQYRFRNVRPK